jgi:long-chain fatty acid transport protein
MDMYTFRKIRSELFIALLGVFFGAGPVIAGGLYISEFGDPIQGASGAGAGALGQVASTAFHNAAGIMNLEPNENHWMASAIYVSPSMKFRNENSTVPPGPTGNGDGGDAGVSAVGGGFWWARPINDKFGFGFALSSISAAAIKYENDGGNPNANNFTGRYWSTEVDLVTLNLMPSVAWRINDQWSVGFSVPIQIGRLDLDVAAQTLPFPGNLPATDGMAQVSDGDDISAAVGISVFWEATDQLRFGAAYQGENELNFNGDLNVTGPGGNPLPLPVDSVDVAIPFVQTIRVWGSSDISDQLTLLASVAWEDWSSFDHLLVSTDVGTGALERDWKDTWKFAFGLRWQTSGAWSHYTGIAYDTSPTSASKRTADMPMDKQWRISAGTNYALKNGVKLGGVLTYADYGDAEINNGGDWGTVVGKYSTNSILFLGANVSW